MREVTPSILFAPTIDNVPGEPVYLVTEHELPTGGRCKKSGTVAVSPADYKF